MALAITTGLKSNRWLRVADPRAPQGWAWQQLSDYTAKLSPSDSVPIKWPKGDDEVYVYVVTTCVRKLYRCQVVIVRQSLEDPLSQARYWASRDLQADLSTLLVHIATHWEIEVLFGDAGLCLSGGRMRLLATPVARSCDYWRGPT